MWKPERKAETKIKAGENCLGSKTGVRKKRKETQERKQVKASKKIDLLSSS